MGIKATHSITRATALAVLHSKLNEAAKAQNDLCKKFKIKSFRNKDPFALCGGFSAVIFESGVKVDPLIWKNVYQSKTEWMPKLGNKEGKEIAKLFNALPVVYGNDLNKCITNKLNFYTHIGYSYNKTDFGFVIDEKWKIKVPSDCKEILSSEYQKLFNKK